MLSIIIYDDELWDEEKEQFIPAKEHKLQLEHSLISISKWESKFKKVFLSSKEKTAEETLYYIKCMTLTQNVSDKVYEKLSLDNIKSINEYIDDPMTATFFSDKQIKKNGREIITSEIIYYWMISFNIPFECQKWHLNRLLTLLKVCDLQNAPKEKMSKKQTALWNAEQNAARRAKYNTRG